jgi:integrase/recombinase XerD
MNIPKYNDIFIKEMKRRNFSQQTIDNYSCCLCKFLSQMTKEHPIHINESDIKEYLCKFSEPNTQRSIHSAIKKFYDICMNQKEKFRFIPYARKSQKLPIVLSEAEMQRMFDACDNIKI